MAEILKILWTFTSVRRRMILHEALVTRQTQTDSISSLEKLSRDAVMLSLISNNTQERLVRPLVDRLGEDLDWNDWKTGKKMLKALASYPGSGGGGESNYCLSEFYSR